MTGIHSIVVEFQNNVVLPIQKDELYQHQSDQFIDFLQQQLQVVLHSFTTLLRRRKYNGKPYKNGSIKKKVTRKTM